MSEAARASGADRAPVGSAAAHAAAPPAEAAAQSSSCWTTNASAARTGGDARRAARPHHAHLADGRGARRAAQRARRGAERDLRAGRHGLRRPAAGVSGGRRLRARRAGWLAAALRLVGRRRSRWQPGRHTRRDARRRAAGAQRGAASLSRGRPGARARPVDLGSTGGLRARAARVGRARPRGAWRARGAAVARRAVSPQAGPDRRASAAHGERRRGRLRVGRGLLADLSMHGRQPAKPMAPRALPTGRCSTCAGGSTRSASTWPSWRCASTPSGTPRRLASCSGWRASRIISRWPSPSACAVLEERLEAGEPFAFPTEALSPPTREVLETFQAMADVQALGGPRGAQTCIVSMSRVPSDALAVLLLAREAGLVDASSCRLDVVPLFETITELRECGAVVRGMLASPRVSRRRPHARRPSAGHGRLLGQQQGRRVPGRNLGDLSSAGGARAGGHGRGRRIDRVSRPRRRRRTRRRVRWAARSWPARAAAAGPIFKITEQGEVIFARYGNLAIAERHLEQVVHALLLSTLRHGAAHGARRVAGGHGAAGRALARGVRAPGQERRLTSWRSSIRRRHFPSWRR